MKCSIKNILLLCIQERLILLLCGYGCRINRIMLEKVMENILLKKIRSLLTESKQWYFVLYSSIIKFYLQSKRGGNMILSNLRGAVTR